jgi:hypothetical protein
MFISYLLRITSYTLSEAHELYLRLAPVIPGTYICRSRPVVLPMNDDEARIMTTSITLRAQCKLKINDYCFK